MLTHLLDIYKAEKAKYEENFGKLKAAALKLKKELKTNQELVRYFILFVKFLFIFKNKFSAHRRTNSNVGSAQTMRGGDDGGRSYQATTLRARQRRRTARAQVHQG